MVTAMKIQVVASLIIMCNEQLHNGNSAIYQHSVIVMLPSCIIYLDGYCHYCEVGVWCLPFHVPSTGTRQ